MGNLSQEPGQNATQTHKAKIDPAETDKNLKYCLHLAETALQKELKKYPGADIQIAVSGPDENSLDLFTVTISITEPLNKTGEPIWKNS